jgi:hypothetical protein
MKNKQFKIEKLAIMGGFKSRIYGEWVEAYEDSQTYKKMMANPERYPEIPKD